MQDQTAQRILITGGSSGIGLEASKQLTQRGHRLTLLCRTAERCQETVRTLSAESEEHIKAEGIAMNLTDLKSIEAGCSTILQKNEPIDTLILNAGIQNVGIKEPRLTEQGIEETFCVNHLAHQLIAMRLLPLLIKSKKPRLVVTSSEVHNPISGGGRVGLPATLGTLAGLKNQKSMAMLNGSVISSWQDILPSNSNKVDKRSQCLHGVQDWSFHKEAVAFFEQVVSKIRSAWLSLRSLQETYFG